LIYDDNLVLLERKFWRYQRGTSKQKP